MFIGLCFQMFIGCFYVFISSGVIGSGVHVFIGSCVHVFMRRGQGVAEQMYECCGSSMQLAGV